MDFKHWANLLRQTFEAWTAHAAPRLGAALAFYTLLSIAPLVILSVAIVAMVFGETNAREEILNQVSAMLGKEGADAVRGMIEHAQAPASGLLASVLGLFTLLLGASGVFGELRDALNLIWEANPPASGGFVNMVRQRLFSFGMVLTIGFLLLVSLVLNAALAAGGKAFANWFPGSELVLGSLNFILSFAAIAVLFTLIYKYVPDKAIAWRHVWIGAVATAFFFTIGKFLIGLYLGGGTMGSPYGAAGSLVVVIIWVYYSAQIFYFGAEFTHVFAKSDLAQHLPDGAAIAPPEPDVIT